MKRPFLAPLLLAAIGLSPRYPPWLFGMRLAAQLSSSMLLVFGGFLMLLTPDWPVVVYALLMLAFGVTNLAALYRIKTAASEPRRLRRWAHICSALLPLAYAIGVLLSGSENGFAWSHLLAVTTPALLNGFTIEQSLQFRRLNRRAGADH